MMCSNKKLESPRVKTNLENKKNKSQYRFIFNASLSFCVLFFYARDAGGVFMPCPSRNHLRLAL